MRRAPVSRSRWPSPHRAAGAAASRWVASSGPLGREPSWQPESGSRSCQGCATLLGRDRPFGCFGVDSIPRALRP
jgi:hypothetical protein